MNVFFSCLAYMVIAGLLAGGIARDVAKECGPVSNKEINIIIGYALLWPVIVGSVLTSDPDDFADEGCK